MSDQINKVTPMDTLRSAILLGKDSERAGYGLPLFLGSVSEQHQAIFETAVVFARLNQMRGDQAEGKDVPLRFINSAEVKYNELKEKHFPDVEQEELGRTLISYFQFIKHRRDNLLAKDDYSEYLNGREFVNTIPQEKMGRMPMVAPRVAKVGKGTSVRERMRTSLMSVNGSPDSFVIMLMNSIIMLRVKTPTAWEVASLINKIALRLQGAGYGVRYRVNSLHLERALISREIVNWVLERSTYWSVADIVTSEELLQVIDKSDINIIATSILGLASPKGVPYRLHCIANNCNHQEDILLDAANMTVLDDVRYPESYMKMITEIINRGKKYTVEELKAARVPYIGHDGVEVPRVLKAGDGSIELTIGSPYLSEYFEAFDYVAGIVNKEIRELAIQYPNDAEFAEKRKELLSSFRMIDYIQYFESYVRRGDPLDEESKDDVIERSEDPGEFIQGMIDMFNEDESLYGDALVEVIRSVPKMTYTFTGILDDNCPACRKRVEEGISKINHGFTPIDPILNFFDQARTLVMQRKDIGQLQEELLS